MALPAGFNAAAYLAANPDVAAAGVDAAEHYQSHGKNENRNLGAGVDNWGRDQEYDPSAVPTAADWGGYMSRNPDLGQNGIDTAAEAMRHYAMFGAKEGRSLASVSTEDLTKQFNAIQQQYTGLNDQYTGLTGQLAAMQAMFAELQKRGAGGAPITGGVNVDDGATFNPGNGAGSTSGVVYGPDGTSYSSAAAALAAGVSNFTYTKPAPGLIEGADTLGNAFMNPNNFSGNANPGANIPNQAQQLFSLGPAKAHRPGNLNPYSV